MEREGVVQIDGRRYQLGVNPKGRRSFTLRVHAWCGSLDLRDIVVSNDRG